MDCECPENARDCKEELPFGDGHTRTNAPARTEGPMVSCVRIEQFRRIFRGEVVAQVAIRVEFKSARKD
jgi:hypothetical protein